MNNIKCFDRVLVAGKGDMAIRVIRALAELGIKSIAVYTEQEKDSLHRMKSDEAYKVSDYNDMTELLRIAKSKRCDAIHPNYTLYFNDPKFAKLCELERITLIGHSEAVILQLQNKVLLKRVAEYCDIPVVNGVRYSLKDVRAAKESAKYIGYPVMLKSINSWYHHMCPVYNESELERSFYTISNQAMSMLNDGSVILEKYLENIKSVIVPVVCDIAGNVFHLYDIDVTLQHNGVKILAFAPALFVKNITRSAILKASAKMAEIINSPGLLTFKYFITNDDKYYFSSISPGLTPEHAVSESLTNLDLAQIQILIAEGYTVDSEEISVAYQSRIKVRGCAIQANIMPLNNAAKPDICTISEFVLPLGPGVRIDEGNIYKCSTLPTETLGSRSLARITVRERSFGDALRRTDRMLNELRIKGVETNAHVIRNVISHPKFINGEFTTKFMDSTDILFFDDDGFKYSIENIMLGFIAKVISLRKCKPDICRPEEVTFNDALYSRRDEFLALGAESYMQKIYRSGELYTVDTSLRVPLRAADVERLSKAIARYLPKTLAVEVLDTETCDYGYNIFFESPWNRIEKVSNAAQNMVIQVRLNSTRLLGYRSFPVHVIQAFVRLLAGSGVHIVSVYNDYDINNVSDMLQVSKAAHDNNIAVDVCIIYMGDANDSVEVGYYIKKLSEAIEIGASMITIEDSQSLLSHDTAKELFTALLAASAIPIRFSSSNPEIIEAVVSCGVNIISVCASAEHTGMCSITLEQMAYALENNRRRPKLSKENIRRLDNCFRQHFSNYKNLYNEISNLKALLYADKKARYEYFIPTAVNVFDFSARGAYLTYKYGIEVKNTHVVSHILFNKLYEDYCIFNNDFLDVYSLDSDIFFYGLALDEERSITFNDGSEVIIRLAAITPDARDGLTEFVFEVNGSRREVLI